MKNWNWIGELKAAAIGLSAIFNLVYPMNDPGQGRLESILIPFLIGVISVPLTFKLNLFLGREISKPNWNDNPFTLKRPLVMASTFSNFFIIVGLSVVIGTAIKYQATNFGGAYSVAFGVGILLGIEVTLKKKRNP